MARPKAEETRKRILESAAKLFARQGLGRTSVREIAAAANVNVALVSHHFGGKDKLYDACVDAMYGELDGLSAALFAALGSGDALDKTIEQAAVRGFHYARAHRGAVRLVMRHVLDTGEVPAERRSTLLLPFLDAASEALSRRTSRTPTEIRLVIQSLLFLLTRYALSSTEELAMVAGCSGEPEAWVLRRVEEQLGRQALWLLGLQPEPRSL